MANQTKEGSTSAKIDLTMLPQVGIIHGALAAEVGHRKYGYFDYRIPMARKSLRMYVAAISRHLSCLIDGEEVDENGISH